MLSALTSLRRDELPDGASALLAVHEPSGRRLLVRTLKALPHERDRRAGFARDFELRETLSCSWALVPTELLDDGIVLALTYEGEPATWRSLAALGPAVSIAEALAYMGAVARALSLMHAAGWVHHDLRPEHVYVDPDGAQARLVAFGCACSGDAVPPRWPDSTAALAHMSPERTGRAGRGVDARSDLYALGVMFYRLLAGVLPFEAGDPLEWVHCHTARPPKPIAEHRPDIPPMLDRLVLRLLEKSAQHRYQTASGLLADLELLWQMLLRGATPPRLGAHDHDGRLKPARQLVGRQRELGALEQAFTRAGAQRTPVFAAISGYSGVGKSALVERLQEFVLARGGSVASGKFDQFDRGTPYSALFAAMRGLASGLLEQAHDELRRSSQRLAAELGGSPGVLAPDMPELALVLGEMPPLPELTAAEALARRHNTFIAFLRAFAQPDRPLVLFLDDLQWADAASLRFLQFMTAAADIAHVLLIVAYRDNEVDATHPVNALLREAAAGTAPLAIRLQPLADDDLVTFVAALLDAPPEEVAPLARLVHEKTGGNPFFAEQLMREVHGKGLLAFDPARTRWHWNVDEIRACNLSENVVELVLGKMRRFAPRTQQVLQQAACIGVAAETEVLCTVTGLPEAELDACLREPMSEGLLVKHGAALCFLHDRVQQAAYALVDERARAMVHLSIGRALLQARQTLAQPNLFSICNQFTQAGTLAVHDGERIRLTELFHDAGVRALRSSAYSTAAELLEQALQLCTCDAWIQRYRFTLELHRHAAEAHYLAGRYDRADALAATAVAQAQSASDRALVHELCIQFLVVRNRLAEAIALGRAALAGLGVPLPDDLHDAAAMEREYRRVRRLAAALGPVEAIAELPAMTDAAMATAMRVLTAVTPACYISSPRLLEYSILAQADITLRHGLTAGSASTFAFYATLLAAARSEIDDGYRFGRLALALAARPESKAYAPRVSHMVHGLLLHYARPLREAIVPLHESIDSAIEVGDLNFAGYSMMHASTSALFAGEALPDVAQRIDARLERCARLGLHFNHRYLGIWRRFAAALRGEHPVVAQAPPATPEALAGGPDALRDMAAQHDHMALFSLHFCRMVLCHLGGEHEAASQAADDADAHWAGNMGLLAQPQHVFYATLARIAAPTITARRQRAKVRLGLRKMRLWALHAPRNFEGKLRLLQAAQAQQGGDARRAMTLAEQALAGARDDGFVHEELLAALFAARLHGTLGHPTAALGYLQRAHAALGAWGAHGLQARIDAEFPQAAQRAAPSDRVSALAPSRLDALTVMRASQAISTQIVLPDLLRALMQIVMEGAGAERGCLFLLHDDGLRIRAQATTGPEGLQIVIDPPPNDDVAKSVLNFVQHTKTRVLVGADRAGPLFAKDDHLRRARPKSVLCLPVLRNQALLGALYLENRHVEDVFTAERCELLELLMAQTAISLENAQLCDRISFRSRHDALTGVLNRSEFEARLLALMADADEQQRAHVLLYVDLDEFGLVNDACGHAAGDELLRDAAAQIGACVRQHDLVARIGGDEFGVLIEGSDAGVGERVAQTICERIATLRIERNGRRFSIGASIGMVLLDGRFDSLSAVMQAADTACSAAKRAGRRRVLSSSQVGGEIARRRDDVDWVSRIETALEEDRFELYAQGIVPSVQNGRPWNCEALLRLAPTQDGASSPGELIRAAERYHLIGRIDRWVLRQVLRMLASLPPGQQLLGRVSVNLSGQSINDLQFHRYVAEALAGASIDPTLLCFEITETAAIAHIDNARAFIETMRGAGARFALDDFGSGVSSFGYLRSLPVDYLKIDGQFIRGIEHDKLNFHTARSITELAHAIGLETVAEFVEHDQAVEVLRGIGVDYLQGFGVHRPEPMARFIERLQRHAGQPA